MNDKTKAKIKEKDALSRTKGRPEGIRDQVQGMKVRLPASTWSMM